jgi:hypothetical protein
LVDPVLDVSEGRAIWRVAQLLVRVNAEQMQHDQFARCRILECLLEQRERAPAHRLARPPGSLVDCLNLIGELRMLAIDGQVVVVADPPDGIARTRGQRQQVLPTFIPLPKIEEISERWNCGRIQRPGLLKHPKTVGILALTFRLLGGYMARIAIKR